MDAVDPLSNRPMVPVYQTPSLSLRRLPHVAQMASISGAEGRHVPPFLRLIQGDRPPPLLLTLFNEHGDEIARATASGEEAAVKSAILLLAQSGTLRPGHRLMVLVANEPR